MVAGGAVAHAGNAIKQYDETQEHHIVRRADPPDVYDDTLRLWAEHEHFLDAVDRLPQTLCHGDAFRRVPFARRTPDGVPETIAIDWAGVGIEWIGMEIAKPVSSTLLHREADYAEAKELDGVVSEGYLHRLRDAGWRCDPRQIRFGHAGRLALMAIESPSGFLRVLVDRRRPDLIGDWGLSIEEAANHVVELVRSQFQSGC